MMRTSGATSVYRSIKPPTAEDRQGASPPAVSIATVVTGTSASCQLAAVTSSSLVALAFVAATNWLKAHPTPSHLPPCPDTYARALDARRKPMSLIADLKSLEPSQRSAIWASYLGWTLDAFDFFLLTFMLKTIAKEFGTDVKAVAGGDSLTLAARPFGAFFFGILADRFGRRPILMVVILAFSLFSAVGFRADRSTSLWSSAPSSGFAMGGEWGIGASLVMESIPAQAARARLGPAPERLSVGLFRRQPRLFPACSTGSAGGACSSSGSRPPCSSS